MKEIWEIVLTNYIAWKGEPLQLFRPQTKYPNLLSRNFSILEYPGMEDYDYKTYCTLGASELQIPHSEIRWGEKGVRFEYIMHASNSFSREALDILTMVACYPYLQHFEFEAGSVIPLGESFLDRSLLEFLYFTYPYIDDAEIYTSEPSGQINSDDLLIQTFWVIPITSAEKQYIEKAGVDAFEEVLYQHNQQNYDAYNLLRPSYV